MKRFLQAVFILSVLGMSASAQEKTVQDSSQQTRAERPFSYYKLEYVLREVQDGKTINSRTYMMTVEDYDRGETKTGARVPVRVGITQVSQYMDVGINLSCRVVGKGDFVSLRTTVEISSFAVPEQSASSEMPPVVRSMRTDMAAAVPIGKQTVIGSIDDVNSTKRYEVAVTATKLK